MGKKNKSKGFGKEYNPKKRSDDEFVNKLPSAMQEQLKRMANYMYNIGDEEDQEHPEDWDELEEGVNLPYGYWDD